MLGVIGLMGLSLGCARKCGNFSLDILDWMPLKTGDEITIKDSISTYQLEVIKSQVDHTVKVGKKTDCVCEDRYSVTLNTTWLNIDIFFHSSKMVETSDVVVNDELLAFSERLSNQVLNGVTYADLVIYKNQNQSANAKFSELTIARSVGLISLKGATLEWFRVDTTPRKPVPAKIVFNDFSCL